MVGERILDRSEREAGQSLEGEEVKGKRNYSVGREIVIEGVIVVYHLVSQYRVRDWKRLIHLSLS